MTKEVRGRLLGLLGVVFIAASLWFLVKSFSAGVHQAGGIGNLLQFNIPLFILSTVLLAVHITVAGFTWHMVTRVSGGHLGFVKGFAIHYLSQVGKYIPGKVWAAMGKFSLSRNAGLTTAQTGQGLILETVFIVLGCLMTAVPLMPFIASEAGLGPATGTIAAIGLSLVLLASVHPFFFSRLASLAAKVMKTETSLRKCTFSEMLTLVPVYFGLFIFLGSAFWVMALAFGLRMPFFPGILIYPAAMGIGYLAIFAPGGLGARELTTVWLIHLVVPDCEPGLAELTALVARLWITAAEVIALGVSFPLFGLSPSGLKELFSGKSPD